MAKQLPINPRIVEQLAKVTVKSLIDGLVELITNSDDSYKRLEQKGNKVIGKIEIHVNRKKGGICEKLRVKDYAEGMTRDELEKAIEFAGETSGFKTGRSVRGLFGRGLKETIIALGEGEIKTIKDGNLCKTKLWFDKREKKPLYDDESLQSIQKTSEENGTEIEINITNEKIKIPEYEKFKEQLSKHYALRDIMASPHREIKLIFEDLKRNQRTESKITFSYPEGKEVIKQEVELPKYGDKVKIIIYESQNPLDSPRNNPYGLAGILITTKGAILDNQLFKFENDPAANYFFGKAICEGLEERLRKGETEIIDPNRGGLEWRHEYCRTLASTIEKILEPLVLAKKKDLEKKPIKEVKESTKKLLKKLCNELNMLAKQELEDMEETSPPGPNIECLIIKPEIANIEVNKPRPFSIYAPDDLVNAEGREVSIKSDSSYIRPLVSTINLDKHPKYPKIWYKYFKVVGDMEGAEGFIIAKLKDSVAGAKVKVAPPKKRKRGKIRGIKKGFIKDIVYDELDNPPQRVVYKESEGVITIFIKFPSVAKFIRSGLEGIETPEGRMLLAELVGDAFCKELARRGIERGNYPLTPGSEIDSFNTTVNELQKKYLHKIQEIIFNWKF